MSSSPAPTTRNTSPYKLHHRDHSTSRPSSRSSLRSLTSSHSLDDPVHVRNQISSLKHNIRHQQAQLHSLENIIRAGPRPYPPDLTASSVSMTSADDALTYTTPTPSTSTAPTSYTTPTPTTKKAKRRSSYDILQGIAGPDSSLPLPRRVDDTPDSNGTDVIREGIPTSFNSSPGIMSSRRPSSPTRSLSRIPVAAVGNARALADDGHHTPSHNHSHTSTPTRQHIPIPSISKSHSSTDLSLNNIQSLTSPTLGGGADISSSSLNPPSPSPRRLSSTPGGTTKVLADLQAGVINARNALENTKSQLRLSQRTVASLQRKVEDLKEVEERLRIENEGLNNVVARKERLLQEVLERARKAEAEATTLKQQLKQETSTSKKSLREMESQLAESTALSKKSEREYITLRDSIKGMVESWKHDTDLLRSEMKKREERGKKEVDGVGKKYRDLVQHVKDREKMWEEEFKKIREHDAQTQKEVEAFWMGEIKKLEGVVEKSGKDCDKASRTAQDLAMELEILRKRMRTVRTSTLDGQKQEDAPSSTVSNGVSSPLTQQKDVPS